MLSLIHADILATLFRIVAWELREDECSLSPWTHCTLHNWWHNFNNNTAEYMYLHSYQLPSSFFLSSLISLHSGEHKSEGYHTEHRKSVLLCTRQVKHAELEFSCVASICTSRLDYKRSWRSSILRPIAEMANGTGIKITVKRGVNNMPAVVDQEERGTVTISKSPRIHIAHVICRLRDPDDPVVPSLIWLVS